jgi:hypothetical protein
MLEPRIGTCGRKADAAAVMITNMKSEVNVFMVAE